MGNEKSVIFSNSVDYGERTILNQV